MELLAIENKLHSKFQIGFSLFRPPFWRVGKVARNTSVCMEIRRQISLITH